MSRILIILPLVAAAVGLASCGSGGGGNEPARFHIMVTEPSHNMRPGSGQLFLHWPCDRSVDPATRYQGAQDALWTSVEGVVGMQVLEADASCAPGSLLTVQTDAGIAQLGSTTTVLRCEVFGSQGERVAVEEVPRNGGGDATCRVPVALRE